MSNKDTFDSLVDLLASPDVPAFVKSFVLNATQSGSREAQVLEEVSEMYKTAKEGVLPTITWYDPPREDHNVGIGTVYIVAETIFWKITFLDGYSGRHLYFLNPNQEVCPAHVIKTFLADGERMRLKMEEERAADPHAIDDSEVANE